MKKTARTFDMDTLRKVVDTIDFYIDKEEPCAKVLAGGQHKVGDIPRFNLPPLLTCGGNCKACMHHCYVIKDYTGPRKKAVAKSHARNFNAVTDDMGKVEEYLIKWITKHNPAFFRIHASGDFAIPHYGHRYAGMWYRVAKACPGTKFLAFTKAFDVVRNVPFDELPNFSLVLSEWTDELEAPKDLKAKYPTSRAVERIEDARDDEIICPGNCETCGMCWALKDLGHNVAFEIH